MVKGLALAAIRRYQRGGGSLKYFNLECNFEPSCSEYTYQAIDKYGLVKGVKLGWNRITRCNDPDCVKKHKDPLL
ncbi:membrane protein insertion efficiency factor YidD [Thalassomonas haliotis]|uniref:Membrane protein insertion efficiency factor YidD n=1 Tax=Thalassomonas haliotis TaxID=485448 RepID=A0ABY7VF28_9GAMM|nr:membrane protein insertion efficiency factor YidD [Thalassomonas haliotis]WDE12181.1 membrane protein insertion efficiency factor YidD [Thalassomonas haliotis]